MDHFWTVLCAIGGAIMAIGGLFGWCVKIVLPKILDSFEKRNEQLTIFIQKTCAAVEKIPESIMSFEKAILGSEQRISDKVETIKDAVVKEIHDDKLKALSDRIDKIPPSRGSAPHFRESDGSQCG